MYSIWKLFYNICIHIYICLLCDLLPDSFIKKTYSDLLSYIRLEPYHNMNNSQNTVWDNTSLLCEKSALFLLEKLCRNPQDCNVNKGDHHCEKLSTICHSGSRVRGRPLKTSSSCLLQRRTLSSINSML